MLLGLHAATPQSDIQTISWSEVVRRIGAIREENPITAISSKSKTKDNSTSTAKLDAHDVANRIMRQENYLIALFNKELVDLRTPLPGFLSNFLTPEKGKGKVLTQALEWNLRFCLMEYLFDAHGKVRKVFLKGKNRAALVEGLRRRFIFMGILNAIFAPFIVLYFLMYSFFRYFEVNTVFLSSTLDVADTAVAISQRPIVHWESAVHSMCSMEVPRIQ